MLAQARVFGYVFNPLTVYWCHRADGPLACVVAAIALVYGFLRSKRGLGLLAIRDNEVAAALQDRLPSAWEGDMATAEGAESP